MNWSKFIQSIFSEGDGQGSMSRLTTFVLLLLLVTVVVYQSIHQSIDHALILELLAAILGSKNIGKYFEVKSENAHASDGTKT